MSWGENDPFGGGRAGPRPPANGRCESEPGSSSLSPVPPGSGSTGSGSAPRPKPRSRKPIPSRSVPSRKGRWSQSEIAKLRDLYGLRDERAIARELKRSPASVRRMAESIFRSASRTGPWSAQEVKQLKHYLGASSAEVIGRILGRDPSEIESKILELGRLQQPQKRWTRMETQRFKRIYGTRSDEDLGVIFGRPVAEVVRHARILCLAKDKAFVRRRDGKGATRMPRWSEDELELLRRDYARGSNIDIAKRLGRSVKSVVSKAHHIGLKKDPERLREMGRQNVSLRYNGRE